MEPYLLIATEALVRFRNGSLTVEQYARSLLSRIEQRDPTIKAWVHVDPEYVIEQARTLDQIPAEQRGPLHGVAIGVKDIIYTKRKSKCRGYERARNNHGHAGMPTQHNSPIYKGDAPELDAGSITILKASGALLLGKA